MAEDLARALRRAQAAQAGAASFAAGVTPGQAGNVGALFRTHPSLRGAAVPLGLAGVPADSSVAEKAARAGVSKRSKSIPEGTEVSGSWMGKVWGAVKDEVLRPAVRYGTAGLMAPGEAVMGGIRTGIGAVRVTADEGFGAGNAFLARQGSVGDVLAQTTVGAGIAEAKERGVLGDIATGRGRSDAENISGDGWFIGPESKAGKRQARNARAQGLIDGHAITLGRTLASTLNIEPGTGAYNTVSGITDMVATLALDPLTYVGGGLAKGSRAKDVITRGPTADYNVPIRVTREGGTTPVMASGVGGTSRVFVAESAGLVSDGLRPTVLPEKAITWLDSKEASAAVDAIAAEKDFERLRRATGKKLPVALLVKLKDEEDPVQIKNLLVEAIEGGGVRNKINFNQKRNWEEKARVFGMMPNSYIDVNDMDDAVEQLDRFQRNIRMHPASISANNERLARSGSNGERLEIVTTILDTIEQGLKASGLDSVTAHSSTRAFSDSLEDMRKYFVDAVGDNADIPGVTIGANGRPLPKAHLSTEILQGIIPLPNARNLKAFTRESAMLRRVESHQGYRNTRDVADFLTNDIFKTFALAIRPAWTVRVVGEEQFRMGAAGLDSAVHHPLSWIAWIAGERPTKLKTIYNDVTGSDEQVEVTGWLNRVMSGGRGGEDVLGANFRDDTIARGVTEFSQGQNVGSSGWRNRIQIQSRSWTTYSREKKQYAESWQDELSQLMLAPEAVLVARKGLPDAQRVFWQADQFKKLRAELQAGDPSLGLDTRAGADRFLETVAERIHTKTAGHPDLLDVVRTGKLNGVPLFHGTQPNKVARRRLAEMAEQGVGPEVVKGRHVGDVVEGGVQKMAGIYDNSAEFMFNALGAVPTNRLSRSPVFRQTYWARVTELAPMLTRADQAALARQAKAAGMGKDTVRAIRDAGKSPAGTLTLEQMDKVSKAHALVETRKLLYSLHEKSQAADAFRVVFPFGEAWREVLTRWARLGTENPLVPYRTAQGLSEGEGVLFSPDPVTGEEMIHIPGSQWVTQKLAGVPVQMDMPMKGMNMFGNVLPGVGPVVSIPVGKMLPENPDFDWVRQAILPYGEAETSGGVVESQLPAYAKKILAAYGHGFDSNQRQMVSTTRDVMAYLYSTGDYDLSTAEGQDELLLAAKEQGQKVYLLRAIAQSTAPSSPTPRFSAHDKDGNLATLFALADDYRTMQEKDYTTATERFLDKYGEYAFLATVGKSEGGAQPTETVNILARQHPEVARKYPTVFGYFAAPSEEIDPGEIQRQVVDGTRTLVGPEKAVATANIRLANAVWQQAQVKVGNTVEPEERAWLREVKDNLKEQYPGYTGGFDSTKSEGTVQELLRAAKDPVLAATPTGEAIGLYLEARKQATDHARGTLDLAGYGDAQAAKPLRDWLRTVAGRLTEEYGEGFGDVFDRVLSREMVEDQ